MILVHTAEPDARLSRKFGSMKIGDLLKSSPTPPRRRPSQHSQQSLPSQQSPSTLSGPPLSEDLRTSSQPSSVQSSSVNLPVLPPHVTGNLQPLESYGTHYNSTHPIKSEQQDQPFPSWQPPPLLPHPPSYGQYPAYQQYPQQRRHQTLAAATLSPGKRPRSLHDHGPAPPSKKKHHQKWDTDENNRVIELRGAGMKWADISKRIPGRTELACRLHYQNYLEKRGEWDEEKKNKLARVYERLKPEIWQPIAAELGIPWRAAEAMHWVLGEQDMARRANAIPFSLVAANSAGPPGEGNGRIAQSTRMQNSTVCFEAREMTVPPGSEPTNGPVSTFANPLHVRRPGGSVGSGGGLYGGGSYEGDEEEEACPSSDETAPRLRRPIRAAGREDRVLPSLAEFEGGVSAWAGPEGNRRRRSRSEDGDDGWGTDRKRRRSE